jgi:hypothetical protein
MHQLRAREKADREGDRKKEGKSWKDETRRESVKRMKSDASSNTAVCYVRQVQNTDYCPLWRSLHFGLFSECISPAVQASCVQFASRSQETEHGKENVEGIFRNRSADRELKSGRRKRPEMFNMKAACNRKNVPMCRYTKEEPDTCRRIFSSSSIKTTWMRGLSSSQQ